jgi:hypothetical protein
VRAGLVQSMPPPGAADLQALVNAGRGDVPLIAGGGEDESRIQTYASLFPMNAASFCAALVSAAGQADRRDSLSGKETPGMPRPKHWIGLCVSE